MLIEGHFDVFSKKQFNCVHFNGGFGEDVDDLLKSTRCSVNCGQKGHNFQTTASLC